MAEQYLILGYDDLGKTGENNTLHWYYSLIKYMMLNYAKNYFGG